ncbi:transcriptional activator FtrA [Variovorax sp. SRS16]|uniref:AraC family transcriptional regulator n=1 Tax=Variovorax sp. SRS16 TaxID=282217 RepID=UPI001319981A|nr:helix-turn-helix domain-containing protein [Variovorax sp. SRS16]VTU29502.1 transcriptional activator FtrA [Variovorax sp. SRS16]
MATMLTLNLLLRGGATGALLLIAVALWRDHPRVIAARLGSGFAISVAAATLASMPGFTVGPDFGALLVVALASGSMFVFWLFTSALFDDDFRLRAWHAGVWAMLAAVGMLHCVGQGIAHAQWEPAAGLALGLMPVAWALLAIGQSVANWREDLIEGRRRLRSLIVAATALYTVAQLLVALLSALSLRAVVESTANAAGIAGLALFVAWRLLREGHDGLFGSAVGGAEPIEHPAAFAASALSPLADAAPAPDARQVAALEALMAVDHVYREANLTIGALAERMALPEHKLRRLINQGLGHRNFSAFLNTYRLADARRWLADPEQADTPILTIAMDAGFQSLGPFNRAFKADTRMTPTEFRRQGTAASVAPSPRGLAESEIG